jgi:anti-sigma28 factor (negative regulator of flagellin synthesis)
VKTVQDRHQERREAKLELIRQQIRAGTLTVRKMTAAERERFPARPAKRKRAAR